MFTLETILDTKVPNVVDLLGPPSSNVQHSISGTVRLSTQKPVKLRQLSVCFQGRAIKARTVSRSKKSSTSLVHSGFSIITTPTLYGPGEHSFPFQLSLPGDLATTDSTKITSPPMNWVYELITSEVHGGRLLSRKNDYHQPLSLKRLHVPPSDMTPARFSTKRADQIDCTILAPKFLSSQEKRIHFVVHLHPYKEAFRIKEISAQAIQRDQIRFDPKNSERDPVEIEEILHSETYVAELVLNSEGNPVATCDNSKDISRKLTIGNPDQVGLSTQWGQEQGIDVELELDLDQISPSESLDWIQITHKVRFTIVFADSKIRNMVVMAPFQIGHVLQEPWSTQPAPVGVTPPDYSLSEDQSTLLDANTARMSRQRLRHELYPEREPIVTTVAEDLPPDYDREERDRLSYSGKRI
ncbi:hypothetical protein B0O80DRAFT_503452 [Mortierella sp. GBAus27b]|nr:hypothetical protein BGX31_009353 [Mortierella sp. GBA43]KAI8346550.1 hypothetical protein B0O80DRAFT_503452 [Mortierella sp. GBAus27b]